MKRASTKASMVLLSTVLLSTASVPDTVQADLPGDFLWHCINILTGVTTKCTEEDDFGNADESPSGPASGGQGHNTPKGSPFMADGANGNLGGLDPTRIAGNPVDLLERNVVRAEIDFLLPVTYGMNLVVSRNYNGNRFPVWGDEEWEAVGWDWDAVFGPGWKSPYDIRFYTNIAPDQDDNYTGQVVEFMLRDEMGHRSLFQTTDNPNVHLTPIFDGPRARLTVNQISSGPDVFEYTMTRANGSELFFNDDGRLTRIRGNVRTQTDEDINIEYDTEDRPWKVYATGDDDRFLRFNYPDSATRQIESVDFIADTTVYEEIVRYEYGIAGLEEVHYGGGIGASYSIRYEHGSFDPGDPDNLDTSKILAIGRVSFAQNGGAWQPLVAYEYETGGLPPIGQEGWVSAQYSYDPETETWNKNLSFGNKSVTYEGTSATQKPLTEVSFNMFDQVNGIFYIDTTSPHAWPFWKRYEDLHGSSNILEGIRAPHELEILAFSDYAADWFVAKQWDYDGANTDWDLQYRLLAERVFHGSGSTDYMETVYEYDTTYPHYVSKVINPEAEEVEFTYYPPTETNVHARGRRASIIRHGVTTTFDYHDGTGTSPAGLLAEVATPFGVTAYEYDSRGQVIKITSPNGSETEFVYNDFGHVSERTTTHLGTWKYAYSTDEYLTDGTTPVPNTEVYFPPRLLETRDPEDNVTRYTHNGAGKIVEIKDPNGIKTEFEYDDLLRLTVVRNGEGDEHEFEYDTYGRMVAFSDGRGLTTNYEYDEFGRVVRIEDPEGTERMFTYGGGWGAGCASCVAGSSGQVSRIEQRDGSFVHYEYDLAGRLLNVEYSGSDSPSSTKQLDFLYDLASRPISVTDSRLPFSGDEYLFIYDTGSTGLLERIIHPDGYTQDFHYDANHLTAGYFDVDGNIVQYTRDALGRVETLRDAYGGETVLEYATISDTGFPVGAVKTRTYGNNAWEQYLYDSLGRIETINHFNPVSSRFDYVSLEYGAAGEILSRERKDGSSFYKTLYEYDDAYRLEQEQNRDGTNTWKNAQFYYYDAAGNRIARMFFNYSDGDAPAYLHANNSNKLEEIMFGYLVPGGEVAHALFDYDDRGNMVERLLRTDHVANEFDKWTYEWNEDDRLVSAKLERLEDSSVVYTAEHKYWYDYVGRRILSELPDGTLVRHYFNGLTEEVRKVSVTDSPDPSDFDFHVSLDGTESTPPSGWPTPDEGPLDFVSDYYELEGEDYYDLGAFYADSGNGLNVQDHRTIATRLRSENAGISAPQILISIETDVGRRLLYYITDKTTADDVTGPIAYVGFTGGRAGNFWAERWVRFERDLQAEVDRLWPGEDLVRVTGVRFHVGTNQTVYVRDITFSNSITIEHNTLGGGAIGHIVRNRRVAPNTAALTDTWFHYDQVGSVLSESDASGNLSATHYQDAFGVRQADWESGLPGGLREGWAHNTKELDGGTGLMYMYQRHYIPEYGMFMSRAPYPPMMEHEYGFAGNNPPVKTDVRGEYFDFDRQMENYTECIKICREETEKAVKRVECFTDDMAVDICIAMVGMAEPMHSQCVADVKQLMGLVRFIPTRFAGGIVFGWCSTICAIWAFDVNPGLPP